MMNRAEMNEEMMAQVNGGNDHHVRRAFAGITENASLVQG